MKAIQIYLTLVVLCVFSMQAFSQDEFYQEVPQEETPAVEVNKGTNSIEDQYYTEDDYYREEGVNPIVEPGNQVYTEEELYDEEEQRKRRRNSETAAIAAEIVVDVLVNTLFVIAFFWQ